VRELQSDLTGSLFQSAFSQEKNKLILSFLAHGREKFLEFHTGAQLPYLYIRDSFHRAKKNTSSFFEESSGKILRNIQIARFERVIKFTFDQFFLFIFFRGKDSNAFVVDVNGKIKPFKTCDSNSLEQISNEFTTIEFGDTFSFSNELPIDASIKDFKTNYPFFGKKIIPEILLRSEGNKKSINESIKEILEEIDSKDFGLFFNEQSNEYSILPESFLTSLKFKEEQTFYFCSEAVREYLLVQFQYQLFQSLFKQTSKYFEKEISYSTSKIEALRKRSNEGSRENLYTEYANLLLINLQSVTKGLTKLEIEDIYHDGKAEIIPLKENLSPNENVNHYFSKAKSEKIFFARAEKEILQLSTRLEIAIEKQKQLSTISTLHELKQFAKVLPLKSETKQSDVPKINFKQFLIDGTWKVFVGKDSKNNDLLTTKFAKQNDFWFHARSVSGSHVVLRVENTKEAVPKPVLKKVAQLAAFYSKAKTAGTAPVSYALKKFVVKRKGMEVGMVSMLREDTLLVKPEIPQGCEMLHDEN
jgi:predicted ribosome quality control (RQC) complex YloA/Tae2 family protein